MPLLFKEKTSSLFVFKIWSSDVNDISVDPPTNLKLRTTKWFSTGKESKKTILEDSDGRVSVLISSKQKSIFFPLGYRREDCHRQIIQQNIDLFTCKIFLTNILDVVFRDKKSFVFIPDVFYVSLPLEA